MASKTAQRSQQPTGLARRDRPWLLPTNRKLRNLISISLRNLSLIRPNPSHQRAKTIDDDAVPLSMKSPAKIIALQEKKALGHSQSSVDLRAVAEHGIDDSERGKQSGDLNGGLVNGNEKVSRVVRPLVRPQTPRMRRRSTLEWINATPQRRHEKLQSVTADRMADVFFSLHVAGIEEPIYVSETVERTMNPTFRNIDFATCGPGITRLDCLTIRIWANSEKAGEWQQLLELSLDLPSLNYLGQSLDHFARPLPQNAVIFHLWDGVYTSFSSLTESGPPLIASPSGAANTRVLPTSSFDALLKLSKLDDSIQDALGTRNKIMADLERLVDRSSEALSERDEVAEADDRLKTIEFAKRTVEKQLEKAHKQQDEKRGSLRARRKLMAADLISRTKANDEMQRSKPGIPILRDEHEVKTKVIQNQRRRICEDLLCCYPISPVPKQNLAFSIHDLHLPNSDELDTGPADVIAAALGHVAHVVLLLAHYLGQPLPYPVTPHSSTSTIYDPVSLLSTNTSTTQSYKDETTLRTYPLFSRGVPRFRFDYGVFLLNSNIKIILESVYNGRILDLRHTLPNLKYLLYIATSGEGELPARKAGGIRGLLKTRPDLERNHSTDSNRSSLSDFWHNGHVSGNGKPKGAADSLRKNMAKG